MSVSKDVSHRRPVPWEKGTSVSAVPGAGTRVVPDPTVWWVLVGGLRVVGPREWRFRLRRDVCAYCLVSGKVPQCRGCSSGVRKPGPFLVLPGADRGRVRRSPLRHERFETRDVPSSKSRDSLWTNDPCVDTYRGSVKLEDSRSSVLLLGGKTAPFTGTSRPLPPRR